MMPKLLLVWLSCLLTVSLVSNVVILSHALEECQEKSPGQSNADFLERITLRREKEPDEGTKTTDSRDPFDFFRLFDGSARDTDSESFLSIAKLFQTIGGGGDHHNTLDFDAGIFGRIDGGQHLSPKEDTKTFLANMFLKTGADERKEGFFDILKVFSQAFDEVKKHWGGAC